MIDIVAWPRSYWTSGLLAGAVVEDRRDQRDRRR